MKVKIRDKIYDANEEPIMLIFESKEEASVVASNINGMGEGLLRYCTFPQLEKWIGDNYKGIKEWMKEDLNE